MKQLTFSLLFVSLYLVPPMCLADTHSLEAKAFKKSVFTLGKEDLETQSTNIADQYDSDE